MHASSYCGVADEQLVHSGGGEELCHSHNHVHLFRLNAQQAFKYMFNFNGILSLHLQAWFCHPYSLLMELCLALNS